MVDNHQPFSVGGRKLSTAGSSFYNTLGVPKGADDDDIKRAYRKAALRFHPDKNPGNPAAADIFKEVGRAYKVLMDPIKRGIYDKYGSVGLSIAEQVGEDNVNAYFMLTNKWCKALMLFCCAITGCFFCCCCCCCCNFCCGKFKPRSPDEASPEEINLRDEEFDDLSPPMQQAAPPYDPKSMRENENFSTNVPTYAPMPPPTRVTVTQQPKSTMPAY